jgi:GH24 family phage-related lysozyme (muramidase)
MKLVPDAKPIALKAFSMWANYLGLICLIMPELIYVMFETDTSPRVWWILGIVLIVGGIIGRIVDQDIDTTKMRSDALTAFLVVAIPFVGQWEGLRNHAYLDRIASPPVWTVCYGETKGVKQGDYYTDKECADMLGRELVAYRSSLHKYFTPQTINSRLTPERDTSYVDLAYNAGIRAAGRSTATRRLNAGNISGGCQALTWWNKAGGRVIRGLVNRRAASYGLCMKGLSA